MEPQNTTKTFLITGTNRGLGFELMMMLLQKNPDVYVIGTTRTNSQKLQNQIRQKTGSKNISILQLDITSPQSIQNLVNQLTVQQIKIDALVNNSAIFLDKASPTDILQGSGVNADIIKQSNNLQIKDVNRTFQTNLFGTIQLTNKLFPFLTDTARIINVSSKLGAMKHYSKQIQNIFESPQLKIEDIELFVTKYLQAYQSGNMEGYFKNTYGASKMLLNAWSRSILSKALKPSQQAIAMSPGHCRTDMGGSQAKRSSQDGALSIYMLLWGEYQSEKFYHCDGVSDYQNCGI